MTKSKSVKSKKLSPVSVRVTQEEREQLLTDAEAHALTLSAYIRERLFSDSGDDCDLLPHETRQKLLAQILAALGDAGYSKSLSKLAQAAQTGVLVLTPDVLAQIDDACTQINETHHALLRALGLRPEKRP